MAETKITPEQMRRKALRALKKDLEEFDERVASALENCEKALALLERHREVRQ